MNNFWGDWMEAVRFTCEAQSVISARLMLFASGAPNAVDEAAEMIAEKIRSLPKPAWRPNELCPKATTFTPPPSAPIRRSRLACMPTAIGCSAPLRTKFVKLAG